MARQARAGRWVLLLAAMVAGAGVLLYQRAYWRVGTPVYRGFHELQETAGGSTVRWTRPVAKIEIPAGWRPLRVVLTLRPAPDELRPGTPVLASVDDVPVARLHVIATQQQYEVIVTNPSRAPDGALGLKLQSELLDMSPERKGVAVLDVQTFPILESGPIARTLLAGAIAGIAIWALVVVRLPRPQRPGRRGAVHALPDWRAPAVFGAVVFVYLAGWAALKPPLQAPDEHTHVIKAVSMPFDRWVAEQEDVPIPRRFWNPLCELPTEIARLYFNPQNSFEEQDAARLKRVTWRWRDWGVERRFSGAWTYPPLFYWAALLLGQGLTESLGLTPYESLFAWRLGVAFMAALLWAWAYRALALVGELKSHRTWLAVFLVANPMLAFMSSAVNPDAVHVPLATLAVLYSFVYARDGTHGRVLFATLLLAALTKPSAGILFAALACAMLAFLVLRCVSWRDALAWVRVSTLAGAVAWLTFYAWSPPRLYGVPRPDTDVQEYLEHVGEVAFRRWTEYWGQLGWLDYNAGPAWYQGLLWIFIGASVLSFLRLPAWRRHASFALFAVLFGVAYFIGAFVGELRYLAAAGFTFQGRYLLPASAAVAVVLLEHWRAWRLVVVVYLLALNVALVQRTVERYYDGSWSRLWSAQAFTRTS